jgi:hypothetical protein
MMSETTKELLFQNFKNEFLFEENGEVYIAIANKSIKTYFVKINDGKEES